MAYPLDDLTNTHLDAGSDDPSQARAELNALLLKVQAMLSYLNGLSATAAELNYNDITTLGTTQASKVVTADANGGVVFAAPSAGTALVVEGGSNSFAGQFTGSSVVGTSRGLVVRAGTNAADYTLSVQNQSGAIAYFYVHGDGGVRVGSPTGGNPGLGIINAKGLQIDGVAVKPSAAFRAYSSAVQLNITSNQLVVFDTENFDTHSDFATNRFTPTIAGQYSCSAQLLWNGTTVTTGDKLYLDFYKNGLFYSQTGITADSTTSANYERFTDVVDMNGTTDYLEVYAANNLRDTSDLYSGSSFGCHLV